MSLMKITPPPCTPIGAYETEFEGFEETDHPKHGVGRKWIFAITRGKHRGEKVSRTTKPDPTPKNSCGRFLAALAGKSPAKDMEIDPDDFIGCRYRVIVAASPESDGTRVETFVRMDDDEDDDDPAGAEADDSDVPFDIPPE